MYGVDYIDVGDKWIRHQHGCSHRVKGRLRLIEWKKILQLEPANRFLLASVATSSFSSTAESTLSIALLTASMAFPKRLPNTVKTPWTRFPTILPPSSTIWGISSIASSTTSIPSSTALLTASPSIASIPTESIASSTSSVTLAAASERSNSEISSDAASAPSWIL